MGEAVTSRYEVFEGPDSIVDAYASALNLQVENRADVVKVSEAVSLDAAYELGLFFATNSSEATRLDKLKDVLYSEIPRLEEAETLISRFAANIQIPDTVTITSRLEAPPGFMTRFVGAHTDKSWISDNGVMVGPFAISLGVTRERTMWSKRIPRQLTWDEMLGDSKPKIVDDFEEKHGTPENAGAQMIMQGVCDLILLPGAPHPSFHEIVSNSNAAVVSGYLFHEKGIDLDQARAGVKG